MGNNYQRRLSKDTTRPPVSVPEQVTVGLGELTGQLAEGLLSLAVATGLQMMSQVMEADVEGWPDPGGATTRVGQPFGTGPGQGR